MRGFQPNDPESPISDALFENDELIWSATIQKRWADAGGARVEIEIQ